MIHYSFRADRAEGAAVTLKDKCFNQYAWKKWSDLRNLADFVVLDVETTGLSPETERVIEIAMVRVIDGVERKRYSSLVCPEKTVSSRITRLTGLTNEEIAAAPLFKSIAHEIADFIGDSVIVAHNATFDLSFVGNELLRCGINKAFTYIDTLALSRKAYPYLKNHKLETLISEFGLAEAQTHRAMDDVECTLALFRRICQSYSSPMGEAISACCSPMTDYQISGAEFPLEGKHFLLMGDFTFTYSAVKKLIAAAGGSVDSRLSDHTDYLVYGYFDPTKYPPEQQELVDSIKVLYGSGGKVRAINEVAFLKLCGVTLYGEV